MEPMKVFFVDDEPIVISDLMTRIDWNLEGFEIKGYAYSAESALTLIKEYMPDLVFVDVALPGMSGLELSAKIREINRNTIIVILSGYMEFDYAQKAMSIGVLTYLVKHQLTAENLIETLKKARATFESRKSADTMIKKQLLVQLFNGERSYDQMQPQQQSYLSVYMEPFQIMGFRPWAPYFYRQDSRWSVLPQHEELLMEENFEGFQIVDTVLYQNMLVAFVRISNNFIGTKALISTAHHCCVAIKESLSRKAEIPFAAAYHTKMSTLKSLESDVSQLNIELDRSIFHRNQVGAARLMSKKASTDYSFITKQAFINNYEHSMERIKNGLEEAWKNKRLTDFIQCTDKIKELLTALNMDLFENDKIINRLYTAQEVSDYLISVLSHARQFNIIKEEYSASTIYVLEYINSNYNKNPSINEVAGKLHSSGMYIGQKIKKETGKSFNEFLTECRMYHAEALLCETNLKVSEISRRVGISNSQYFRRIFQEFTGQSPNDYRKQLLLK